MYRTVPRSAGDDESPASSPTGPGLAPIVLSFDVEEHHRIEAASRAWTSIPTVQSSITASGCGKSTEWILERARRAGEIRATFFIVGPDREDRTRSWSAPIHEAGHEVASHGWDHRRIHVMDPESFREDVRMSKDALEQACGATVRRIPGTHFQRRAADRLGPGYPRGVGTSSMIRRSTRSATIVTECQMHRGARSWHAAARREILELPPATLRVGAVNVPIGGGGIFPAAAFAPHEDGPLALASRPGCGATVLYFHPWEFDPDQPRLPLGRLSRFRTYVGIRHSRGRLCRLLSVSPSSARHLARVRKARCALRDPSSSETREQELPCSVTIPALMAVADRGVG